MKLLSRRNFIKNSITTGAAIALTAKIPVWGQVRGANDAIRIAIIGLGGDRIRYQNGKSFQGRGGKGSFMIPEFRNIPGVRIAAICDVDKYNLERDIKKFDDLNEKPDTCVDFRKLLDRKDIDVFYIAACNHWHALMTIWACQAGKDVYVEKPVSHNISEGRKMVEAARKYNRIVQSGTHRRSNDAIRKSIEFIQQGNLGKIKLARAICYRERPSIGKVDGPQPVAATVDYDLWCGPAPKEPLMRKNLHYDWHWFWNTGSGELGDLGSHHVDVCRWALGQNQLPKKVISIGSRFGYTDDGQTPNTQIAFFDYEPAPLVWEVRGLYSKKDSKIMDDFLGIRENSVIHCEDGFVVPGSWAYDKNGKKIKQFSSEQKETHAQNFIKAVRSRKISDLKADILEGHLSSAICHMGNISHRIGQKASPEQITEAIKNNIETSEAFERMRSHLKANEIDLQKEMAILGPFLSFDSGSERFTGRLSENANELLTRKYREPFALPDKI